MQLRSWIRPAAMAAGLCVVLAPRGEAFPDADEQTVDYLIQFFTDSQKITVRSSIGTYALALPSNTAFNVHWNNEKVVVPAIEAPPGTQEAVDAITTASRPISGNPYEDYVKVRNEVEGTLARGPAAATYYVSSETDYLAQQISGSYNRDFIDQLFNISIGASFGWDEIKPLADDDTPGSGGRKTTLHWNAVATRVLTPKTVVRAGLELNMVNGLQHNSYRNVYAGGTNVPEHHPDQRQRRDAFLRLNQYFDNRSSLRLHYRLYSDDWGINSHEAGAKLSQYVTHGVFVRYRYRWYTQSDAEFYRDEYTTTQGVDGYLTGDYRMAALSAHLFGLALNYDLDGIAQGIEVLSRTGVWISYERYFNSNNYSSNTFSTGLAYHF